MVETHKLTKNQKLVVEALKSAEGPLSAYAILEELRPHGVKAPLQVYRALDKLMELKLIHKVESMSAYVACVQPDCHTHKTVGFAICSSCNGVQELPENVVSLHLDNWAQETGFVRSGIALEVRGTCKTCRENETAETCC